MKMLLIGMMMLAGTASAETITLGTMLCTGTQVCFNVPNDAGVTIEYISDATQYKRLLVEINGEIYDSGLWKVYGPLVDVPLYAGDGTSLLATINISIVYGKCVQMGRAASCPRTVTLLGGTLVR